MTAFTGIAGEIIRISCGGVSKRGGVENFSPRLNEDDWVGSVVDRVRVAIG